MHWFVQIPFYQVTHTKFAEEYNLIWEKILNSEVNISWKILGPEVWTVTTGLNIMHAVF